MSELALKARLNRLAALTKLAKRRSNLFLEDFCEPQRAVRRRVQTKMAAPFPKPQRDWPLAA